MPGICDRGRALPTVYPGVVPEIERGGLQMDKTDLLKKVKALAERGVGGEAANEAATETAGEQEEVEE